jgi:HIP---CoA ligase
MAAPLPATIPHAAMAAALRWGDAPALIEGSEDWSFAQLWQEARRAIAACLSAGICPGDRVAIWAPNRREWVSAAIGAMGCGAAIVPLNTRLKGREAGDMLRRTGAKLLFTVQEFLGTDYSALLTDEAVPALRQTVLLDRQWSSFLATGDAILPPQVDAALASLTPDTLSDIMFTSGTTGSPKGVLTTHHNIMPQTAAWIAHTGLREGDRYLLVNPFFHSFGMKVGWVACLLAGATMVPMAQFEVAQAAALIAQERISFLPGPPTIFQMLLSEKESRPFDSSSLRGGTTGAASVPPVLVERIRAELGMSGIITAYGMTECPTITCCSPGDPVDLIAQSCGVAFPGHDVIIAGPDGCELPRGETGEIRVRGPGVMLGYLDDPAATAEAIDFEGWLHTGDVGTMDKAGYVRITDRMKDLYISGGFNCYPAEIEKLLAAHPGIAMAAVIGAPDDRLGEVGAAYIVPRPGAVLDAGELRDWSRANMANYKVPRIFHIVDDLPRNAAGKIMKRELRLPVSSDGALNPLI